MQVNLPSKAVFDGHQSIPLALDIAKTSLKRWKYIKLI